MNKPDLIPLTEADPPRENPMVWTGEEQAQGVFLDTGEALDLLGTPSLQAPPEPRLPIDFTPGPALRATLGKLRAAVHAGAAGGPGERIEAGGLDAQSRQALEEMLGEGEVRGSVTLDGVTFTVRETVLPGLWWLRGSDDSAWLEVASIPQVVETAAASLAPAPFPVPSQEAVSGVMNGLAVLAEINEHASAGCDDQQRNRVLNFTLMPMSPQDQQLLIDVLGRADLALESGGFGHCRVIATTVRHVWAVQYVNAMGNTILDTLEIGGVPDAVVAASQDLEDSARRLDEILDTYLT
ncbi:MAG: hydrogenase expression/formation protein [Haliea sp.]|nr:hydrogenase expression/formation protein [Haliea sp.]